MTRAEIHLLHMRSCLAQAESQDFMAQAHEADGETEYAASYRDMANQSRASAELYRGMAKGQHVPLDRPEVIA